MLEIKIHTNANSMEKDQILFDFDAIFAHENPAQNTYNSRIAEMHAICEWNKEFSAQTIYKIVTKMMSTLDFL